MKSQLLLTAAIFLAASSNLGFAQTTKGSEANEASSSTREAGAPGSSGSRDASPADQQRPTGPVDTTAGGVSASSPQGDSPPGMQPQPQGSSAQDPQSSGSSR
jgi:hypothetical protein